MQQRKIRRVVFDANPLATSSPTGISYYTRGVIQSIARRYPDIEFVGHYFGRLKSDDKLNLPTMNNVRFKKSSIIPQKIVNMLRRIGIGVPYELLTKTKGDIYFFPAYLGLPTIFSRPRIIAIHDLSYLTHPDTLSARNQSDLEKFIPKEIEKASLILTISENSKRELLKHYAVSAEKILVHGIPPEKSSLTTKGEFLEIRRKFGIKSKYLLFTGTLEPRKNIEWLVEAFVKSSLGKTHQLVLAGGLGWKSERISSTIEKYKSTEMIIHAGYVSERNKSVLLSNCDALVMASLMEGFGMPILEAASYGKPALLSDIPVFHEVAGRGALYFNNSSVESFDSIARKLLTNKSVYKETSLLAKNNLNRFNWDEIAEEIMSRLMAL